MRGIFFWFNSMMAISKGSVSPDVSTIDGAFMLFMISILTAKVG